MEKLIQKPVSELEAGRENSPLRVVKTSFPIRKFNRGARLLKAVKPRPGSINLNK